MLTEKRKADRAEMARHVAAMGRARGFAVDVFPEPSPLGKRATVVHIDFGRGFSINIDFDGESCQPNTFVLSWYVSPLVPDGVRFADTFGADVNQFHRRKATDVAHGFDNLLCLLTARFVAIQSGKAFEAVP